MTSYELTVNGLTRSCTEDKMREFRRPTLCVIDEHGSEVSHMAFPDNGKNNDNSSIENNVSLSLENMTICDHNANISKVVTNNHLSPTDPDLSELKATTARLKLSTRRQSTVAWQDKHLDSSKSPVKPIFKPPEMNNSIDEGFTEERKTRINEALAWLRSELLQMRSQDETLARTLLSIRQDIHQLKLERSCEEHRDMLDDITMDMEETSQINEFCDLPIMDSVSDTPLKHLGVTRMHLNARRFSTC